MINNKKTIYETVESKYILSNILVFMYIVFVSFFSTISIEMYLPIWFYSIIIIFFLNYLFIHVIKNKKAVNLINFGFLFQYTMIVWIYSNAVNLGSIENPYLFKDALLYHNLAVDFAQSETPIKTLLNTGINYLGYPMILGIFYKIFYPNLMMGLLLNVSLGLFNVFLAARIAKLVTNNQQVVYYTVLFFIISPQMNTASTYLLKDVFIISSFLMIILSVVFYLKHYYKPAFFYFLTGVIIISLFRLPMAPVFLAMAFFLINNKFGIREIFLLVGMLVIFMLIYNTTKGFAHVQYLEGGLSSIVEMSKGFSDHMDFSGAKSFTERLVADYDQWSLGKRIIFIPIFSAVQYLTPFAFWTFDYTLAVDHLNNMQVIWLFFLGAITIFTILNYKKIDQPIIKKMFLFGIFGFVLMAFMYGGTLPRYAFPFYSILIIGTAYIYVQIKENITLRKKYFHFYLFYILISIILGIVYLIIKII